MKKVNSEMLLELQKKEKFLYLSSLGHDEVTHQCRFSAEKSILT